MAASPSPSPEVDFSIGSVLDGRYRIDAILGSGGMGRVYRGEHTGIGRAVAIKVLHADLSRNREAAQRFQREALASGRLDHPNIVGVSDFGILEDGPCYLVMEALEGESLGARLSREQRIPWPEAIEILRGVLLGLRHAHDRGVVHRDIKPDNVFLARKDGETVVKILDFGIAKLYAGSPDDPAATRAGLTVGTPAYLSPEQAVGGEIKPASDLYSATIVLFEMIAGRPPFEDKDPLAMLGAHVSRQPPTIAELAPELGVPAELEDVIQRGLLKAAAERIGAAAEYLALLEGVVAAAPRSSAVVISPPPSAPSPAAEGLGVAPTAAFTPAPGPGTATPMPGVVTPPPGMATPVPGVVTPPPGTLSAVPVGAAPTTLLSTRTRASSLADAAPIPRKWIKLGAIVLAVLVAGALVLALASRTDESRGGPSPGAGSTLPGSDGPRNASPTPAVPMGLPGSFDRETRLKALLHDLESAKTCTDRKAAIPELVALGDPRAIAPLKKARYRMRGGVLGLGRSNTNGCLKADAEAAIKALGGSLR